MLAGGRACLVFFVAGEELVYVLWGSSRLGRHPDNDLQLLDSVVSKFHCRIEPRGSGHVLTDLGSFNGTYINGQRLVGERLLVDGDSIAVGHTELRYRTAEPKAAEPRQQSGALLHGRFVGALRGLLQTADESAQLSSLLLVAIELFEADWGAVVELSADGTPRRRFSLALPGRCAPQAESRFDPELVDRAVRSGHTAIRVEWTGDAYRASKPKTLVALPLTTGARTLGVLWLERAGANERGPFAELELLGSLAAFRADWHARGTT